MAKLRRIGLLPAIFAAFKIRCVAIWPYHGSGPGDFVVRIGEGAALALGGYFTMVGKCSYLSQPCRVSAFRLEHRWSSRDGRFCHLDMADYFPHSAVTVRNFVKFRTF